MTEAEITINGVKLSVGQSMALRVAATSFMEEISGHGALEDDEHGQRIAKSYRERIAEVLKIMTFPIGAALPR